MRFAGLRLTVLLLVCVPSLRAQTLTADQDHSGSVVSGHVFCADTHAPARSATVSLEPVEAIDDPLRNDRTPGHAQRTYTVISVQTSLDGSYAVHGIEPGTYYVAASLPGYLSSYGALGFSQDDFFYLDAAERKLMMKRMPRVVVEAGLPATMDVSLERGASVSGTILYDDGSPAVHLHVQVLIRSRHSKGEWVALGDSPLLHQARFSTETDDRGAYRISGLVAHEYIVEAALSAAGPSRSLVSSNGASGSSDSGWETLSFFSGNTARQQDAKPFTLTAGEERPGEDITLPLSKLHVVAGSLVAARDGHTVNSGSLSLLRRTDRYPAARVSFGLQDQNFVFHFVPEGDYVLSVDWAADTELIEKPFPGANPPQTYLETHPAHLYGVVEQPLTVDRDIHNLSIAVPEVDAKHENSRP